MPALACTIRPAHARDVDAIHAIEVASFADPWKRDGFRDMILAGNATVVVAERTPLLRPPSGDPAGHGAADPPTIIGFAVSYAAADEAEIANLAVAAPARRSGIGRALVDHVIADASRAGATMVFLDVRASNAVARALYATLGFTELSRRKAYYSNPREDAVVMRLDLANAVI